MGELANLAKMYTDKAKYIGENNSFTIRLTIFHDICAREDEPQEIKLNLFSIILTGQALDCCYSNISISNSIALDVVCDSI